MPIDKLNDDVLAEVFKAATSSSSSGDHARRMRATIALSHVGSRWRRVALSTPALWTMVHASNSRTTLAYTPQEDRDFFEAFLTRSGALPLDVHINVWGIELEGFGYLRTIPMFDRCEKLQISGFFPYDTIDDLCNTVRVLDLPSTLLLSELSIYGAATLISNYQNTVLALCSLVRSCQVKRLRMFDSAIRLDDTILLASELPTLVYFEASQSEDAGYSDLGALEILEFVDERHHVSVPSLQTLDISTRFLSRPVKGSNFRTVRRLYLTACICPSSEYVVATICGLPSLQDLVLGVNISHSHEEDMAPKWSPPALISIDFAESANFDDVARLLVEGTTTDILGVGSLKSVDISRCHLSEGLRVWIEQRVPKVVIQLDWF